VENAPSSEGHPKQQTTFSDLPAELRNAIWHAALAPRVIMIYPRDGRSDTDSLNQVDYKKVPGMLFANRESRKIALHHYDQRFTFTFSEPAPTEEGGVMCRIPVIMSTHDELAFSHSYLSARCLQFDQVLASVDAADGFPKPCIKRISLLGDSIMRKSINEEHLARHLSPDPNVWDTRDNIDFVGQDSFWNTEWISFAKFPGIRTLGPWLEDGENIYIRFDNGMIPQNFSYDEWLLRHFYVFCCIYIVDWDGICALVVELPEPTSSNID
jgi:hypothetical protein